MRILHLVHQYPPEHEGDFTVFCTKNGHFTLTKRFLITFGNRTLGTLFGEILTSFQPDIVHIQHLMGWPAHLLSVLTQRQIPYVITLLDFWWICASTHLLTIHSRQVCDGPRAWLNCTRCVIARSNSPFSWGAAPALWPLLTWRGKALQTYLHRASLLLTPTRFTKEIYVQQGVSESNIHVLPWGVDRPAPLDDSQPNPCHIQHKQTLRFIYVGGITWQKGIHILIEAFQQIDGDCELWVVGNLDFDPAYSAELQANATDNVHFLGQLARPEVWQCFKEADITVVPAIWYETFSLLAHEAYIAGCPVLASRRGALAEVVQHEVSGLLIEPGNVTEWQVAIQRCIDDPALVEQWRQQLPIPLTVDEHVEQVDAMYHTIADKAL